MAVAAKQLSTVEERKETVESLVRATDKLHLPILLAQLTHTGELPILLVFIGSSMLFGYIVLTLDADSPPGLLPILLVDLFLCLFFYIALNKQTQQDSESP